MKVKTKDGLTFLDTLQKELLAKDKDVIVEALYL